MTSGIVLIAIVFIAIVFIFVLVGISAIKTNKEDLKKLTDANIDQNEFIDSGKLLTGHPMVDKQIEETKMYIKENIIYLHEKRKEKLYPVIPHFALIESSKIKDVIIEDASTIEKRITATRLLTVGLFAFALKKKEKNELAYLTIKWNDGKFDNETIFEFKGIDATQRGNTVRNSIIRSMQSI